VKKKTIRDCPYDYRCYFLTKSRMELFRSIDFRCEKMIQSGFLQEVVSLVKSGALTVLRENATEMTPAERSIGYRQALDLIANTTRILSESKDITDEEVLDKVDTEFLEFLKVFMAASRQFSVRQLKSFRREPMFFWIESSSDLPSVLRRELDMPPEQFWRERVGDAARNWHDYKDSASTGRYLTDKDHKLMQKCMKEFISRFEYYGEKPERLVAVRNFIEALRAAGLATDA